MDAVFPRYVVSVSFYHARVVSGRGAGDARPVPVAFDVVQAELHAAVLKKERVIFLFFNHFRFLTASENLISNFLFVPRNTLVQRK